MNYFGVTPFADMDGQDLQPVIENDEKIHDTILYGVHGGQVNVYDGRYVYMRGSVARDSKIYNMTLMPTNMRGFFAKEELKDAELVNGGRYSHDTPVMKVPSYHSTGSFVRWPDALYDKKTDPDQKNSLTDETLIKDMTAKLEKSLEKAGAPDWQYIRLGIENREDY